MLSWLPIPRAEHQSLRRPRVGLACFCTAEHGSVDIMLHANDAPPLFAQAIYSAGHDTEELSLGAEGHQAQTQVAVLLRRYKVA